MDTRTDPALPISEGDQPRDATATGQEHRDGPADTEPGAMPDAWINLLFGLLVMVFTLAAAWNWLRA